MSDRIINPMALWGRPMSDADMWRLIEAAADLEQVAKRLLKEHADTLRLARLGSHSELFG